MKIDAYPPIVVAIVLLPLLCSAEESAFRRHPDPGRTNGVQRADQGARNADHAVSVRAPAKTVSRAGRGLDDQDIITTWRERMFSALSKHTAPHASDITRENRQESNTELAFRKRESTIVMRTVMKETLQLTQEQLPGLDRLVKALRLEVSTNMIAGERNDDAGDGPRVERTGRTRNGGKARLFAKTGLRIPIDRGKLGVLSETEAVYGNLSSFFKVYLDGRHDNTVGLVYALGGDVSLQAERRVEHRAVSGSDEQAGKTTSLSLLQLVCVF